MRAFAKFLVFSNLILSLVFLAWSVTLYTQRMDWAPHKNVLSGERDEKSGRLYHLTEEIKELVEYRDLAEKRYQHDAAGLPGLENKRLEFQKWYLDQKALAETGRDSQGKAEPIPVIQLERIPNNKEGLFITDAKQRKSAQVNGKDVKSIDDYRKDSAKMKKELDDIQEEILKLIDENKKLTDDIAGVPGKSYGLRKNFDDLTVQKKAFDDELAILKPHLAAQRINVEQQKRRMDELDRRLKDLQKLAGLPQLPPLNLK
jgi:hypothetical protein